MCYIKDVKAKGAPCAVLCRKPLPAAVRPVLLGISAAVLLTACHSVQPSGSVQLTEPSPALTRVAPGPLAVASATEPVLFSFDAPQGKLESAGEGAANATRRVLNTPNLLHPQLEAVVGVVEFAAAPFAAGYGALNGSHQKLPPEKLAETEAELKQTMNAVAQQEQLRELVCERAKEKTGRRLVSPSDQAPDSSGPIAVLHTRVESLRLAKLGNSDSSYVLQVNARARLVRTADHKVLYDRPYEFRSGKDMFIDWARAGGLESVAQTAYHNLADQIVKDLVAPVNEPPVLLGAGFHANPQGKSDSHSLLAANRAHSAPGLMPVALKFGAPDSLEIYSQGPVPNLLIQRPMTKDEAVSEAQSQTEWKLDGLENDRNFVVQAVACVAAVPFGLWEQTVGVVRGVPGTEMEKADQMVQAVAQEQRPYERLAREVAAHVAPDNFRTVLRANHRLPDRSASQPQVILCSARAHGGAAASTDDTVSAGKALGIRLLSASLSGNGGINPKLALTLEAEATLVRLSDGRELYRCPVSYRSAGQKFTRWAAHDARLLRQEFDTAYGQMGRAIVEQLTSRGLLQQPAPATFAGN